MQGDSWNWTTSAQLSPCVGRPSGNNLVLGHYPTRHDSPSAAQQTEAKFFAEAKRPHQLPSLKHVCKSFVAGEGKLHRQPVEMGSTTGGGKLERYVVSGFQNRHVRLKVNRRIRPAGCNHEVIILGKPLCQYLNWPSKYLRQILLLLLLLLSVEIYAAQVVARIITVVSPHLLPDCPSVCPLCLHACCWLPFTFSLSLSLSLSLTLQNFPFAPRTDFLPSRTVATQRNVIAAAATPQRPPLLHLTFSLSACKSIVSLLFQFCDETHNPKP